MGTRIASAGERELFRPGTGAGAKGEDKRRGHKQILDEVGGEFARVDVP